MPHPDSRGFFKLPQRPEGAAYYTYGTPSNGLMQYAHPRTPSFLFQLEFRWGAIESRKLGFGNISLAGGPKADHKTHMRGLEIDIRPLRKDGRPMAVRYQDIAYDREATQRLVDVIWQTGMVWRVLFNDPAVSRVLRVPGHDNHLHIDIRA